MTSYLAIALFIVGLELLRRCCLILLTAFTGPLSKVPGPFWMKISNLPWNMMQIRGDQLIEGPALLAKYGNIVRITPKAVIVAGTNEIYRIIVQDDFKKGPDYEMINSRPDVTTLFTERDKVVYKQKRRMMSPGFSIAYLNGLEPSMHECVRIFEEKLISDCAQSGGSAIVDISNILSNLGSDILSETVLGKSLDLVRSNDTKLKNIFMERTERAALYANFPLLKYLPFMPPAVNPEFNKMVEDIVAQRRAVSPEKRKRDLLQIFLDQNEADPVAFSEDNLREEIQLFMVAGSDTTSYTATCSLLLLLNNPTALQTLIQEINTAFPRKDDFIAFDKTQSLPYLNAVINESMRLMPVAGAGLHRQVDKPTNIHGYELPAGTILQPWVAKPMKDETLFPRPNDFVPERWLGEYKGVQVDRKAFLPFSAGSRSCIGQQYALRELRLIIVTLLRRFELSIVPGQSHEIRIHVVPSLKQGYYSIKIKPRTS